MALGSRSVVPSGFVPSQGRCVAHRGGGAATHGTLRLAGGGWGKRQRCVVNLEICPLMLIQEKTSLGLRYRILLRRVSSFPCTTAPWPPCCPHTDLLSSSVSKVTHCSQENRARVGSQRGRGPPFPGRDVGWPSASVCPASSCTSRAQVRSAPSVLSAEGAGI